MDPNACYSRFIRAVRTNDIPEALDAHHDLTQWIKAGGFPPAWNEHQKLTFKLWPYRYRLTRNDTINDSVGERIPLLTSFLACGADAEVMSALVNLTASELATIAIFMADFAQRHVEESRKGKS